MSKAATSTVHAPASFASSEATSASGSTPRYGPMTRAAVLVGGLVWVEVHDLEPGHSRHGSRVLPRHRLEHIAQVRCGVRRDEQHAPPGVGQRHRGRRRDRGLADTALAGEQHETGRPSDPVDRRELRHGLLVCRCSRRRVANTGARPTRGRPPRRRTLASGLEHHHRSRGRPRPCVCVEPDIDLGPPLPQSVSLFALGSACTHIAGPLMRQSNGGVRMRLQVEPPRGMTLVPAIHREDNEVGTVFDVADDDAPVTSGLPANRRQTQGPPATFAGRSPQEAPAAQSIHRTVATPECVLEPWRGKLRLLGRRSAQCHGPSQPLAYSQNSASRSDTSSVRLPTRRQVGPMVLRSPAARRTQPSECTELVHRRTSEHGRRSLPRPTSLRTPKSTPRVTTARGQAITRHVRNGSLPRTARDLGRRRMDANGTKVPCP